MNITGFSFPTTIKFGAGARTLVAQHLRDQGLKRPLIVTDRALAALPVLAEFKTHLGGLDVAVFSGVFGNPTCSQVMDGAAAYKAHGADCIIGFGGGAAGVFELDDLWGAAIGGEPVLHFLGGRGEGGH